MKIEFYKHNLAKEEKQKVLECLDGIFLTTGQWFYAPGWKSTIAPWVRDSVQPRDGCWLVFSDGGGLCQHFIGLLRAQGRDVTVVVPGSDFNSLKSGEFTLRPGHRADMAALLAQLKTSAKLPCNIVHLWSGAGMESTASAANDLDGSLASGFYSLLHLAQTLASTRRRIASS